MILHHAIHINQLFSGSQVYLPWDKIIPADPVHGATIIGLLIFFSYAIVANTVVPISLYVSVEVSFQLELQASTATFAMLDLDRFSRDGVG